MTREIKDLLRVMGDEGQSKELMGFLHHRVILLICFQ